MMLADEHTPNPTARIDARIDNRPAPRRTARIATTAAAAAAIALVIPLAACSTTAAPGSGTEASAPKSTLVYATGDAEPDCLDPHVGGNFPQALAASQVLESLVSLDTKGAIVPWLAKEWKSSADGLSWDFTLDPAASRCPGL
ncbi:MAG: hypothetical protein J0H64_06925, partial [Actinobacteria bacterium]|nr:hypothetical protein [Actinomycetota bacterium]